jgi:hypothetical protein
MSSRFLLGEIRRELSEVLESRRAFSQIPLEPSQCRLLVFRRPAIRVEMHELERVGEDAA